MKEKILKIIKKAQKGTLIAKEATEAMVAVFQDFTNETMLGLSLNDIDDKGAELIANAIINPNCKIQSLDLSHNTFGDKGAELIANAVKNTLCQILELRIFFEDKKKRRR